MIKEVLWDDNIEEEVYYLRPFDSENYLEGFENCWYLKIVKEVRRQSLGWYCDINMPFFLSEYFPIFLKPEPVELMIWDHDKSDCIDELKVKFYDQLLYSISKISDQHKKGVKMVFTRKQKIKKILNDE